MNNKLPIFLYLLMRDYLPTGVVCSIIAELEKVKAEPKFSNKELAEMAQRYSDSIVNSEVH